jgi:hypothetical protein
LRYVQQGVNNTIASIFDLAANQQIPSSQMRDPNSYYFAMTNLMQDLLNIGITKVSDTSTVDVYEFLYGIKSINFSQLQYLNEGIYVSKPYTIPSAGAIGLDTVDSIPSLTAIEYDVLVEYDDLVSPSGTPQFVSSFAQNILPANVINIEGEVLDLTDDLQTASTSDITRFGVTNLNTVQVFQNNVLLSPSFYTLTKDITTNKVTIKILDSQIAPSQRHISLYTINYQPTTDSYTVNLDRHTQAIISLRMFLRSLSPNAMLTPSISSYSMKFKKYT